MIRLFKYKNIYKSIFLLVVLSTVFLSCSKNSDDNPASNEQNATGFIRASANGVGWYSNVISTSKTSSARYLKASQSLTNNANFSSAVLEFWISVNQTGEYGIGEQEPGYTYAVRAAYTLKSKDGINDEVYKAYFQDYSFLNVNGISESNLDANFIFRAYNTDFTKSVVISEGVIKIDF